MADELQQALMATLRQRRIEGGGFRSQTSTGYRSDATAWAILACRAAGLQSRDLDPARARLAADQQADGRVSVTPQHPEAFWPTFLAVLAWHQAPDFHGAESRAVQFLLNTTGVHFPNYPGSPLGHNTAIKGWPWIADTHSWVYPTSMAVMALRVTGHGDHERVQEAKRLLLDRQLPGGGWNFGNTTVFGQQLSPAADYTGVALSALAGEVPRGEISASLVYLQTRAAQVRTPLTLGWSLLGLGAWRERPPEAPQWLSECWQRQERYGTYNTEDVSLMLLALTSPPGILSLFGQKAA